MHTTISRRLSSACVCSPQVDYYTYGACRLASDGAYYCGSLSTLAPYKGLTDTEDSPHIGTDPVTRHDAPTGSTVYGVNSWSKVRGGQATSRPPQPPSHHGTLPHGPLPSQ